MKKVLIFIGGVVVGIIICIIIGYIVGGSNDPNIGKAGKTMFETERDFESTNCFEVIQVLDTGDALAKEVEMESSMYYMSTGTVVMLQGEDGTSYYDNQIIEVPKGKSAKQIGIYKYLTRGNFEKTIPIIVIK